MLSWLPPKALNRPALDLVLSQEPMFYEEKILNFSHRYKKVNQRIQVICPKSHHQLELKKKKKTEKDLVLHKPNLDSTVKTFTLGC